ncbi:MAG: hypothetical protein EOP04_01890 [Proteobacteria bacterium]|nr:MAG: hypothetical protein EOP04_01890 [Pseudomonadota bacterium]
MKTISFAFAAALLLFNSGLSNAEERIDCFESEQSEVGAVTSFQFEKIDGRNWVTAVTVQQCGQGGSCSTYSYPKNKIETMVGSGDRDLPFIRVAATRETGHFVLYAFDYKKKGRIYGQTISRPVTSPLTFIGNIECDFKKVQDSIR